MLCSPHFCNLQNSTSISDKSPSKGKKGVNEQINQPENKRHEEVSTPKQEPESMICNIRFTTSINMDGTSSVIAVKFEN